MSLRTMDEGPMPRGYFVCIEATSWESVAPHLREEEAASTEHLGRRRRVSWGAGRIALRLALERQGIREMGPILATARGAPLLPIGLQGSISHKGTVATAIAAHRDDHRLGIDIEKVKPRYGHLVGRVLTDRERLEVSRLPLGDVPLRAARVFSFKEAIFKAVDPWLQRPVSFSEVELVFEGGEYRARHQLTHVGRAVHLNLFTRLLEGHVVTFAAASLGEPA